jgi:hypothetical protein
MECSNSASLSPHPDDAFNIIGLSGRNSQNNAASAFFIKELKLRTDSQLQFIALRQ